MAKPFGDPKRVKGQIKMSFTQADLDSTDFQSRVIQLGKDLQSKEIAFRIDYITHIQFTQLRSKLFHLKRKKYIHDFYFDLTEDFDGKYYGSLVMCYNKVNI